MKQLNIGIIGAGRIGKVHMKSITYSVPGAKVLGITDVFKDALPALAAEYGIEKIYDSYTDMLADPEIDAVLVCSSTATHGLSSPSAVPFRRGSRRTSSTTPASPGDSRATTFYRNWILRNVPNSGEARRIGFRFARYSTCCPSRAVSPAISRR